MKKHKAFSLIELSIVILIIGIIIAGITQSSRVVSQMRLNTARSLTQSSPATSIKGLALWLETTGENSFGTTTPDDTTAIANQTALACTVGGTNTTCAWADNNPTVVLKSHATVIGSAITYAASAINGLPAVKFNGTASSFFAVQMNSSYLAQPRTSFVVVSPMNTMSPGYIFDNNYLTATGASAQNYLNITTGTNFQAGINNTGIISSVSQTTPSPSIGGVYVITVIENGTNTSTNYSATIRVNGNNTNTATLVAGTFSPIMNIGCGALTPAATSYTASCTSPASMYLGEVIVFDRSLVAEEYKAVENYLGKKWGVKLTS